MRQGGLNLVNRSGLRTTQWGGWREALSPGERRSSEVRNLIIVIVASSLTLIACSSPVAVKDGKATSPAVPLAESSINPL